MMIRQDFVAVGRKEILALLHVDNWRTVCSWKIKDAGFRKLIMQHPITGKPILIFSEYKKWIFEFNLNREENP